MPFNAKSLLRSVKRPGALIGAAAGGAGGAVAGATSSENKGRNALAFGAAGALGGAFAGHVSSVRNAKALRGARGTMNAAGRGGVGPGAKLAFNVAPAARQALSRRAAGKTMGYLGAIRSAPRGASMLSSTGAERTLISSSGGSKAIGALTDARKARSAAGMGKIGSHELATAALLALKARAKKRNKKLHDRRHGAPQDDDAGEKDLKHQEDVANEGPSQEKEAEALWDEIEGGPRRFLRDAPVPDDFAIGAPPRLDPKLAFDMGGVRIPVRPNAGPGRIADDLLKMAAVTMPKTPRDQLASAGFRAVSRLDDQARAVPGAIAAAARSGVEAEALAMREVESAVEHVHPPALRPGVAGWLSEAGESLGAFGKTLFTGKGSVTPAQKWQVGGILTGLAAGGALLGAAVHRRNLDRQYGAVLKYVMDDPELQNESDYSSRVPQAYKFLQRYAPTLAQDSVMARAFVRQILKGSGIDALNFRLANELAQAEQSYRSGSSVMHEYSDINRMLQHPFSRLLGGSGGGKGDKK